MRLIDADKLILHLNDYALQESPSNVESAEDRKISREVYFAIQNCMKAVEEQPTAFDVDKISKELVKKKKIANKKMNESDDTYSMSYYNGFSSGLAIAIGIVKGGRVDRKLSRRKDADLLREFDFIRFCLLAEIQERR